MFVEGVPSAEVAWEQRSHLAQGIPIGRRLFYKTFACVTKQYRFRNYFCEWWWWCKETELSRQFKGQSELGVAVIHIVSV